MGRLHDERTLVLAVLRLWVPELAPYARVEVFRFLRALEVFQRGSEVVGIFELCVDLPSLALQDIRQPC